MTQVALGPVNITQGNSATFVAEFLDSNNNITNPLLATITVSYTNTANVTQTDTLNLAVAGSLYTGTWSSTSAAKGLANWSLFSSTGTNAVQVGVIRVIDP